MPLVRTQPRLTMLMQEGCPACASVKPEFAKLARIQGLRLGMIDLAKADGKVPVPVKAIPGFLLELDGRMHYADAQDFAEKAGVAPDAENLTKWIKACVERKGA